MKKIEGVIDMCDCRCRYFGKFESAKDNYTTCYICTIKPALISIEHNKDVFEYEFPPFCPLEDYDGEGSTVYND